MEKIDFPKIGTTVSLTELEIKICLKTALERTKSNREKNVEDSKSGPMDHDEQEKEGFLAEFSFCKMFNLMPDFSIGKKSTSDGSDTGDAILPNGMVVDVKSTTYQSGKVTSALWKAKNKSIDLCVLLVGSNGNYSLRGFVSCEELYQEKNIGKLKNAPGYKDCYMVSQDQLKEIDEYIKMPVNLGRS